MRRGRGGRREERMRDRGGQEGMRTLRQKRGEWIRRRGEEEKRRRGGAERRRGEESGGRQLGTEGSELPRGSGHIPTGVTWPRPIVM